MTIRKSGSRWKLWSKKKPRRVLGTHKTKTGAQKQERAILAHRGRRVDFSVMSTLLWPAPIVSTILGGIWGLASFILIFIEKTDVAYKPVLLFPAWILDTILPIPASFGELDIITAGVTIILLFLASIKIGAFIGFLLGFILLMKVK